MGVANKCYMGRGRCLGRVWVQEVQGVAQKVLYKPRNVCKGQHRSGEFTVG